MDYRIPGADVSGCREYLERLAYGLASMFEAFGFEWDEATDYESVLKAVTAVAQFGIEASATAFTGGEEEESCLMVKVEVAMY